MKLKKITTFEVDDKITACAKNLISAQIVDGNWKVLTKKEAFEKERAARHKKYHWRDSKNAVNDAENYTVSVIKQRDKKGGHR